MLEKLKANKTVIGWLLIAIGVVAVNIFLGVSYPIPEPPIVSPMGDATVLTDLNLGQGVAVDTALVYDGNAQDFYIALDDSADDLLVGLGSTVGTTPAFAVDENLVTTWSGGTIELTETATTTDTLTAVECGKTYFLNEAGGFTLTLPAVSGVSAGCEFGFIAVTAPITAAYTILTGNSDEDVLIGGINELEVDTGDDGPYDASADTISFVAATAVVGDYVYLVSNGSYFYVRGQANADGGVTITDSD